MRASEAAFSANASNITSGTIGQAFLPADVVYNNQANTYTLGKQTLAASTTLTASMNVPAGAAPTGTPTAGDLYAITGADSHLQFVDQTNNVQELAFMSDVTAANASVATETARALAAEALLGTDITN